MFDYNNLSPNEFEVLCSDLLSRKLNVELRHFSPGRDGGVDLTESPTDKKIIVQVKHYAKSTYQSLKRSLIAELAKLKKMNPSPNEYYICVSQKLTAANIAELYQFFKEYMSSDKNIFTKNEIDQMLNSTENEDILRKNYKLWLLSDKILTEIISRDIFIDGEVLLSNIEDEFKYFIQTELFNNCLEILKVERKLLLCGDPGVGKSITSKMLTLYFAKNGYKIRYTSNGIISDLKRSLQDNRELKEVILLDDCLGQYYLRLRDRQDVELISLLDYISINTNKILILNSRVTVLNEAQNQSGLLRRYLENEKLKIKTINMNNISNIEKALIFYNHLIGNNVPNKYYDSVRSNGNYKAIVNHSNYNPRLIEYVTHRLRYENTRPEDYFKFILATLENPKEVWKEEFSNGLDVADRILMHTLFSLTDTYIDDVILKECFEKRVFNLSNIDHTLNVYEASKTRLNSSLIKTVFDKDKLKIGVLNPSIYDFISNHLLDNHIELQKMVNKSIYIEQIEKLLGNNSKIKILELIENAGILDKKSINSKIGLYIIIYIFEHRILNSEYIEFLEEGLEGLKNTRGSSINKADVVLLLLTDKEFREFYKIIDKLDSPGSYEFTKKLFRGLNIEELINLFEEVERMKVELEDLDEMNEVETKTYWVFESILTEILIDEYIVALEDFIDEYELIEVVEQCSLDELLRSKRDNLEEIYESEYIYIKNSSVERLEDLVIENLDKIKNWIDLSYRKSTNYLENLLDRVYDKVDAELEGIINSLFEEEYDYESYFERKKDDYLTEDDIDIILDRTL